MRGNWLSIRLVTMNLGGSSDDGGKIKKNS
jgi:hypothetical protein